MKKILDKHIGFRLTVSSKSIIQILTIALPFADMINGFLIRQKGIKGLGSGYHLLVLILLFFVWLKKGKIRINTFFIVNCVFLSFAFLSFWLNMMWGASFTSIGIERESKIISTLALVLFFDSFLQDGVLSLSELKKILNYQTWIVGVGVFLCDFLGIYNAAYTGGHGRMGLYSNMNEISIILAASLFFQIRTIQKRLKINTIILVLILITDLLLIQSKFSLGCIALFLLYVSFLFLSRISKVVPLKNIVIVSIIIISTIGLLFLFKSQIKHIFQSFFERLIFLKNVYGGSGVSIDYLSSGRTTRFDILVVEPIKNIFSNNPIRGITIFLIGKGFTGSMIDTFEMDIFDLFLFNGVIGVVAYFWVNIHYILQIKKNKTISKCIYVYCIIAASILVGHVWLGGVCGIYYAMFCTFAKFDNKSNNNVLL